MNNLVGRSSAQLDTFSGTITISDPPNLPEGASPRNTNCDFDIGSCFTRSGLVNPFTYQNGAAGPSPGGDTISTGWTSPNNVLVDTGVFASINYIGSGSTFLNTVSTSQTGSGLAWVNLPFIYTSAGATVPTSPTTLSNVANLLLNFAFLPANSVIAGIQIIFNASCNVLGASPSLLFTAGAGSKSQAITNTDTVYTLGGPTDNWGSGFTAANVISGVTFNVAPVSDTIASTITVHSMSIQVFYAPPSTPLSIEQFGFSVPASANPQGFQIAINGYSISPAFVDVQMIKAGVPVGNVETIALPVGSPAIVTLGGINDLFGTTWTFADLNNTQFGVQITVAAGSSTFIYIGYTTLTVYFTPTQQNFNYVTTFEDNFQNIRTLALDNTGQWWVEQVPSGILAPLFSGPPAGSFATSFTENSRQYIAISDLLSGSYPPQQYTGDPTQSRPDRVSQVGPGAPPQFTPIVGAGITYNIVSITQPAAHSQGFSYFLQATGPGSSTAGNVVTFYYQDSTLGGPDADLVAAFNSGYPVYVYASFTGGPATQGPYTVLVTSVNKGQPPGQPRQFYYFTFNVSNVAYTYYQGSGHSGYTANWQRSLATMTMASPVPDLVIGSKIAILGTSVTAFNSNWIVSETLNSGTFTINDTSISSGVATYNYSLITGVAPFAGQTVTITNTLNGNGQLNMVNAVIVSATGGTNGSFTINVSLPDSSPATEQGQATTAGTIFAFDPGLLTLGTATNPIYGNATGGTITFAGNGQFVSAGTRQGVVFFITRNGYFTHPSPPVTFTCPAQTGSIKATQIPIGPANVIARGIAFTEAGQNEVPGANFFTIPTPVSYYVAGVKYTTSALLINDNTSSTATFFFNDNVLLAAQAIDIQGNDLFNLVEIGDPAWNTQYAGRTVWGRVRTKIQNFLNMSFDGGYLQNPGANLLPLGWNLYKPSVPNDAQPTLLNSPVFGNSWYVHNTDAAAQAQFSLIYQSAYQDYNNVAILQNNTAYSVRITVRTPSSAATGDLIVDLATFDPSSGFGPVYGTFDLPLASMSSTMLTYQGTILTSETLTIPSTLMLRVWGKNIAPGADIEIDRLDIFPTIDPTNLTQLTMSYSSDPESFDDVTGGIDTTTTNTQPANGAFTMHDLLYVVKESSLGYVSDSPNQEPANWNPYKEVSNVVGASGINAYDVGEEWAVMACQNGLFLFNGGAPIPINLEVQDIWKAINWKCGHTICVRNDVANRKIFCAVPLPTPNPWMVDATVNANPTVPNVVIMLNYEMIGNVTELMEASSLHVTMTGKLAVRDMNRKWSLWTIPVPYIGLIKRNELYSTMMFCNGIQSSKIYYLGSDQTGQDDNVPFTTTYCTYGFVDQTQAAENPLMGLYNKRYAYYDALITGSGTAQATFYQNVLTAPYPFVVPGGWTLESPSSNDLEGPLDEFGQRIFCEVIMTNGWFNLSRLSLMGALDKWSQIRGK